MVLRESDPTQKLQKTLAQAGYGSRRELERWIDSGRISVNGVKAERGMRVNPRDVICIDGRRVWGGETPVRVLRYHKPVGEICSRKDPEGRASVFDALPPLKVGRWVAVGRLDVVTSGLMLFTNSGDLAHHLMHPSTGVEREYAVRIYGEVAEAMLRRLCAGVAVEEDGGGETIMRFARIRDAGGEGTNHWYHVTLTEGRNREVRRLWESQGLRVSRLHRVRFGSVELPRGLRSGRWEELAPPDLERLFQAVGWKPPTPRARVEPRRRQGHRKRDRSARGV